MLIRKTDFYISYCYKWVFFALIQSFTAHLNFNGVQSTDVPKLDAVSQWGRCSFESIRCLIITSWTSIAFDSFLWMIFEIFLLTAALLFFRKLTLRSKSTVTPTKWSHEWKNIPKDPLWNFTVNLLVQNFWECNFYIR